MSDKKIIAVVGATGQQGGGLARAILDDPAGQFAVRAITRRPDSDAARALAARGAEVVTGDLDDEASLTKALPGAYGACFVTAFLEYNFVEHEQSQGRAMAAVEAGGIPDREKLLWIGAGSALAADLLWDGQLDLTFRTSGRRYAPPPEVGFRRGCSWWWRRRAGRVLAAGAG